MIIKIILESLSAVLTILGLAFKRRAKIASCTLFEAASQVLFANNKSYSDSTNVPHLQVKGNFYDPGSCDFNLTLTEQLIVVVIRLRFICFYEYVLWFLSDFDESKALSPIY